MKVNVLPIVWDHINTLRDSRTGHHSLTDFILFFSIPISCAGIPFFWQVRFDDSFYNVSITFFGIFIALLLNVQVAMFSVFQRKWQVPIDPHLAQIQTNKLSDRKEMLGELNSNLSYLVLVSCIALFLFLLFFVIDISERVAAATTCTVYAHFLLTLMMSVKRAHTLFQMEYEGHC